MSKYSNSKYKSKYLKYKNKYLQEKYELENENMNENANANTIITETSSISDKRPNLNNTTVKTINEVKHLISNLKCPEAISSIIAKGKYIKQLTDKEIAHVASDLILTDTNAYWNLL